MYQVLARTWRPQNFEELVGQPHVARTLTNAIESDRLAHAYVFAGLRGTGKTTVARILAKCLNCEQGPTATPCGKCVACQEIADSRAMDVLELDAASRTGIDDIRELQEMISYAPARDRFKLLILDEVHMLSTKAFNALLKTLEEPPTNVKFVLATTELHKIPTTILSRCQVFDFRRVTVGELSGHLRKICKKEKIEISDAALGKIARAGEGSVRDSLSLLERALAFCGQTIPDEEVLRMLGAVETQVLVEFVGALAARDAGGMLGALDGLIDEGHDLLHFWNELIAAIRDLLLVQALPGRTELLARSPEDAEALSRAAEGLSREDLTRSFQILADLEPGLKSSGQPQFLFEATLIRLSGLGAVRPIEEILQTLGEAPAPGGAPPRRKTPTASVAPPAAGAPLAGDQPVARPPKKKEPPRSAGGTANLVEAIRSNRPMIAAMLEQATVRLGDDALDIDLPAGMEVVKRQLERRDNLSLLKQQAEQIAGTALEVRIAIDSANATAAPEQVAPAPATDRAAGGPESAPPRAENRQANLLEKARQEPGVQSLLDTFGAQVVEIRSLEVEESS